MELLIFVVKAIDPILMFVLPMTVLLLSLRRFFISVSFNRLLYAIVAFNATLALYGQLGSAPQDAVLATLTRIAAYGILPLWFLVCEVCRSTGSTSAYEDGWITFYAKPVRPPVADTASKAIRGGAWQKRPPSRVRPAALSTPNGPVVATRAVHGTP